MEKYIEKLWMLILKIGNIFFEIGIIGMVAIGFIVIYVIIHFHVMRFWRFYRMKKVKVGQNYVLVTHENNPFKETKYKYLEITGISKGFVEYICEGNNESMRLKVFVDVYTLWPHEHRNG